MVGPIGGSEAGKCAHVAALYARAGANVSVHAQAYCEARGEPTIASSAVGVICWAVLESHPPTRFFVVSA
jgi:hypothetical protein